MGQRPDHVGQLVGLTETTGRHRALDEIGVAQRELVEQVGVETSGYHAIDGDAVGGRPRPERATWSIR